MDWSKFKLPLPVYQQEIGEKCIVFLQRILNSLQSSTEMEKEDAVFWFLIGVREDVIRKIPFDPNKSLWIDPTELEGQLEKIDDGEELEGPHRTYRFQKCFNFFICFNCGNWGHKSSLCRNGKRALNKSVKRKLMGIYYYEADAEEDEKKRKKSDTEHV